MPQVKSRMEMQALGSSLSSDEVGEDVAATLTCELQLSLQELLPFLKARELAINLSQLHCGRSNCEG